MCDGLWYVGDVFWYVDGFIENIKMMFGYVDFDVMKGYVYDVCFCDVRFVGVVLCNCLG